MFQKLTEQCGISKIANVISIILLACILVIFISLVQTNIVLEDMIHLVDEKADIAIERADFAIERADTVAEYYSTIYDMVNIMLEMQVAQVEAPIFDEDLRYLCFIDEESGQARLVSYTNDEVMLAYLVLVAEAGNQPFEGQCAVVQCFVDRLKNGFGDTLSEVLLAPGQFASPYKGDTTDFEMCWDAIAYVLFNGGRVYEEDVIFFYNPKIAAKSAVKWLEKKPYIGQIGDHVFRSDDESR